MYVLFVINPGHSVPLLKCPKLSNEKHIRRRLHLPTIYTTCETAFSQLLPCWSRAGSIYQYQSYAHQHDIKPFSVHFSGLFRTRLNQTTG